MPRAVSFTSSKPSCGRWSAVSVRSRRRRILIFVCGHVSRTIRAVRLTWHRFARRGFALATVLVVFATGAFLVRNVLDRPTSTGEEAVSSNPQPALPESPKQVEASKASPDNSGQQVVASNPEKRPRPIKNERSTTPRTPRRLVAADFSSERAEVISGKETVSTF